MNTLISLIAKHGILTIFIVILLEYACFPISSEIVLPFSGAIAQSGNIPFPLLLISSIAAGITGTTICYGLGRYGGEVLLNRLASRFPKIKKGLNSSKEKFSRYGAFAVCIGRLIPICRTYIAFIAGAYRQPYLIYLLFSSLGIALWNTLLLGLGYCFRENWSVTAAYYGKYKSFVIPLLLLVLLFFIGKRLTKGEKKL